MNKNIIIAKKLINIAKQLIAEPHKLKSNEVIRLNGEYNNLTDNFKAMISSQDSRQINNESR